MKKRWKINYLPNERPHLFRIKTQVPLSFAFCSLSLWRTCMNMQSLLMLQISLFQHLCVPWPSFGPPASLPAGAGAAEVYINTFISSGFSAVLAAHHWRSCSGSAVLFNLNEQWGGVSVYWVLMGYTEWPLTKPPASSCLITAQVS